MSVQTIASSSNLRPAQAASFGRIGGIAAALAGVGGLLYAISFVIISRSNPALGGLLSALFLMLNGLFSTVALTALYERVRTSGAAASWAILMGGVAALGAAIHGGYDLANALHPPATLNLDLPNPIDPRGLMTFGVTGMAMLGFAWLIAQHPDLPRRLAYLGYLLGALLIVIYLARLLILNPANPVLLVPVLLTGFVVNPIWYIWLGITLMREPRL